MRKIWIGAALLGLVTAAFLAGSWVTWRASAPGHSGPARQARYYICPMHPQYRADRPGDCPTCGMRLQPVHADDSSALSGTTLPPGTLRVPAEKQQLIGVRVAIVEAAPVNKAIGTVGRVAVDQNRVYRLVATTDGIVRSLLPFSTGSFVQREQVLLTFYSSEFLTAQQAYFYALNTLDRITKDTTEVTEQQLSTSAQLRGAVDSLRNLGMSDAQLAAIGETRRLVRDIELRSPVSGYVLSRAVFPDQRLDRGEELYQIADLSRVWVLADLFENDLQYVRPGTMATLSFPSRQGRTLQARVSNVLPQVDPATRTLKVRLEIDNPDLVLRPDMFVNVALAVSLPRAVTVPADAVVDSGTRKTVFVDRGNGYFEPRRVETGWRFDDRIEVVKGLVSGERIVVSGNFLLDSESRMKTAAMGIFSPETDPICGMDVDRDKAASAGRTSTARGETYFFCSDLCKRQFDAEPQKHTRTGPSQSSAVREVPPPLGVGVPADRVDVDHGAERVRQAERTMNMTAADAGGRTIFATDPVSGAEVDTTDPEAPRSVYQGSTYYFITRECKAEFDTDPAKFAVEARSAHAAGPQAAAKSAAMANATAPATDPVCRMDVDPKDARAAGRTSDYRGRTHYFCSAQCKKQFDTEPGTYVVK